MLVLVILDCLWEYCIVFGFCCRDFKNDYILVGIVNNVFILCLYCGNLDLFVLIIEVNFFNLVGVLF